MISIKERIFEILAGGGHHFNFDLLSAVAMETHQPINGSETYGIDR